MGAKLIRTQTFECVCSHLAYFIRGRGWLCMCDAPVPKNPNRLKAPPKATKAIGVS
jgi:hypothetical protein